MGRVGPMSLSADELIPRHQPPRASPHGNQLGHRLAVNGDGHIVFGFRLPQHAGGVMLQVACRYLRPGARLGA